MAEILIFAPSGDEIAHYRNAQFDSTDIGQDSPDGKFTCIQIPTGTVEIYGEVIVLVYALKEDKKDESV